MGDFATQELKMIKRCKKNPSWTRRFIIFWSDEGTDTMSLKTRAEQYGKIIGRFRKCLHRKFQDLFILRESEWAVGGPEGERESLSRLPTEHRSRPGDLSQDPEIITQAKIQSWLLKWLNYPGAPLCRNSRKDTIIETQGAHEFRDVRKEWERNVSVQNNC